MPLILQLVRITVCKGKNCDFFHGTVLQKCGRDNNCSLAWSEEFQHPAIQTKIIQSFGGFFHQSKVRQPIGRKDSIQTMIGSSRRLDSYLHEVAQNFEVVSNIQN
jgi:hypothetical protein